MSTKRLVVVAVGVALAAFAAVAVDLPWVCDSSGRTIVDTKCVVAANHAEAFATMAGHWSYESNTSRLRTEKWEGITIIVR